MFHYECEQGVARFEADMAGGRTQDWPQRRHALLPRASRHHAPWPLKTQPRSLHPTQGMPALAAALRAANEATVGRARLFSPAKS